MRLRVKTTDSFGESYDNTFSATKEVSKLGIKYSYTDEIARVRVFVLKDKVQIIREGEVKSNTLLKENQTTNFDYKASYMSRNFEIFTKELKIEDKKITSTYSIFEGNEVVNELKLLIEEL